MDWLAIARNVSTLRRLDAPDITDIRQGAPCLVEESRITRLSLARRRRGPLVRRHDALLDADSLPVIVKRLFCALEVDHLGNDALGLGVFLAPSPCLECLVSDPFELRRLVSLNALGGRSKLLGEPVFDAPEHPRHGCLVDSKFIRDALLGPKFLPQFPGSPLALSGHLLRRSCRHLCTLGMHRRAPNNETRLLLEAGKYRAHG